MPDDLVAACQVYYAQHVDPYEHSYLLVSWDTPEQALLQKEGFKELSNHALVVIDVVLSSKGGVLPNGDKLNKRGIKEYIRKAFGWPWKVIEATMIELRNHLNYH